ncbi:hypothetical protein BD311DRAFT_328741 [Dichomitus squalens]|uniref:Uncharacterized protein n=1 Tax=Dichomitus squalens TaxID=114155 RepID=A0A4Q9PFZ1_9APHY|nr:hypothetical protein BD311DRAFT_328741 [Dichomitus squalens]TBU51952.1 hypothetical protein BD310DRAFT_274465 [Dichomitus squalens]
MAPTAPYITERPQDRTLPTCKRVASSFLHRTVPISQLVRQSSIIDSGLYLSSHIASCTISDFQVGQDSVRCLERLSLVLNSLESTSEVRIESACAIHITGDFNRGTSRETLGVCALGVIEVLDRFTITPSSIYSQHHRIAPRASPSVSNNRRSLEHVSI